MSTWINRAVFCSVLLCAAGQAQAAAYVRGGGNGPNYSLIGAKAGIVDIDNLGTTLTLGAFADIGATENIAVNVGLDYWNDSEEEHGVKTTVRDLAIGGFAKFFIPTRRARIAPYVGAGLALHMLEARVRYESALHSYSDSETELGFDIGGGLQVAASRDSAYVVEMRYRSVDEDYDVDHLAITFGFNKAI